MSRDTFDLIVTGMSCTFGLLCLCAITDSSLKIARHMKLMSSSIMALEYMQSRVVDSAERGQHNKKCCGRACGC